MCKQLLQGYLRLTFFQFPNYPGIKELVNDYVSRSAALSTEFMRYVSEGLSLAPTTFEEFKGNMDRLKFVKYPHAPVDSQGVGPHKDSTGLFTFLSQDETGGLQVLNHNGEWIDAPPVEGSLVVNIQQGFEAITGGVCTATTHRVIVSYPHFCFEINPELTRQAPTNKTRYSIPFFSGVRMDLTLEQLQESTAQIVRKIPASDDRKKRAVDVPSEFLSPLYSCVSVLLCLYSYFKYPLTGQFGEAYLRNRVLSHPDVGQKWYPELHAKYSQQVLK